jgi:Tetratricopeptide repeat
VLGDDHPHTLNSASNLATDLRRLGRHKQARRLEEDFGLNHRALRT